MVYNSNYLLHDSDTNQKWKLVPVNAAPKGEVESVTTGNGTVRIKGWVFDFNDLNSAVKLHVYVGGPAGSGAKCYVVGTANAKRTDVDAEYGCGPNHGFDITFNVNETGTKGIYVYAINTPSGTNPQIGKTKTVTISRTYTSNISSSASGSSGSGSGIGSSSSGSSTGSGSGSGGGISGTSGSSGGSGGSSGNSSSSDSGSNPSSAISGVSVSEAYYQVVFKGNGSTGGSMSSEGMPRNTSMQLNYCEFTRTGYIFKNWNTKKNGSGKSYKDGAFVKNLTKKKNGKVTLYAQWKPIKYDIAFDSNGGTGSMKTAINRKYGKTYALAKNAFKKKGYKFAGWNTEPDGSGKTYKNKGKIKNLTSDNGETVMLYAQWKER